MKLKVARESTQYCLTFIINTIYSCCALCKCSNLLLSSESYDWHGEAGFTRCLANLADPHRDLNKSILQEFSAVLHPEILLLLKSIIVYFIQFLMR